jgi:hypothetical protein
MLKQLALLCVLTVLIPRPARAQEPLLRVERTSVPGGAELVTIFSTATDEGEDVPLLSLLRDTLNDDDPRNDRLRSVWVLTQSNPSILERAAAAIPFFYWQPRQSVDTTGIGRPVMDLGNASRSVWTSLTHSLLQVIALDPRGTMIRASTRRYRLNTTARRRAEISDSLVVLSALEQIPEARGVLSDDDLLQVQARLSLAGRALGGLVSEEKLSDAYFARRNESRATRGHNWELLRQRAELNGLYFEPLGLMGSATHAMLFIDRRDVGGDGREFDGTFLGIQSPYRDRRLEGWSGPNVTRSYDATGRIVPADTAGAITRELIPLALYALDYPKVPLLLVDFRRTHGPKSREVLSRAAAETATGLLGLSVWGNWSYAAGSFVWNFVRTRHGAPTDADRRIDAYGAARRWLALDPSLETVWRAELQRRLETMGVNPLDGSAHGEAELARRRYAALLDYARADDGLATRLKEDRASELTRYEHGAAGRAGLALATIASLGFYSHRERTNGLLTRLDEERRSVRDTRLAENGPRPPSPGVSSGESLKGDSLNGGSSPCLFGLTSWTRTAAATADRPGLKSEKLLPSGPRGACNAQPGD